MKRRKFLLTSGTAILGSTAVQSLSQESAIALNFDLVGVENADPSTLDTIIVDFQTFKLTPKYVNEEGENAVITITIDIEGQDKIQTQSNVPLTNGSTINKSDLGSAVPIVHDGINTNQTSLNGILKIDITHPSISDSYTQEFTIQDAPSVEIVADSKNISAGDTIEFTANVTYEGPDSLQYTWDFNDNGTTDATGTNPSYTYDYSGTYTPKVTVHDESGNSDSDKTTIDVKGIGETGSVEISADQTNWQTINFQQKYSDPVIIIKPLSYDGSDPAHVRVSNVTSNSADVTIEEWSSTDGPHTTETASYVVMESGEWTLSDGTEVKAGYTNTSSSFTTVNFNSTFNSKPTVFTKSQTKNETDQIVTRNYNVTTNGFETKVEESEAKGQHGTEEIGYIAIEQGQGQSNNISFEVGNTGNSVTNEWSTISFSNSYSSNRNFVADMQTHDGPNTAGLRYRNLGSNSVDIFIEEETTNDDEVSHTSEVIGYWIINENGILVQN